jgi:hypothetical protein
MRIPIKIITCFAVLIISLPVAAKKKPTSPFSKLELVPHMGVSWQSPLFKPVFDFSYLNELGTVFYPYFHERNTQGFGLDLGYTLTTNVTEHSYIGFGMNGRFRYDYFYGGSEAWGEVYEKMVKTFFFHYRASIIYDYKNNRGRDWIAEVGFTTNQMGKSKTFDLSRDQTGEYFTLNYQYSSYNFGIGYDLIRLNDKLYVHTGFVANYIPKGHPAYPNRDFMTLGFKTAIRFKPGVMKLR